MTSPHRDQPQPSLRATKNSVVRVNDLSFTYPGHSTPAIQNLTFDVQEGEVFGFLGPSGAGKTTTQNILIGLIRNWSGHIQVLGRPLHEWPADYYEKIGVCFELPNHYLKLTARENLAYFQALYQWHTQSVEEALTIVGLEAHIDQPVDEYSKGMKTRLNFARSLLHRPQLWFLDEPTSGLDPGNAVRVRELIRERQKLGVTTLVTTHDMITAQMVCDRVAFIVDGRIAVIDSPDALCQRYGRPEVEVRWEESDPNQTGMQRFPLAGLAENAEFLSALRRPTLTAIHSLEATLEDVFLQVTGRTLQ